MAWKSWHPLLDGLSLWRPSDFAGSCFQKYRGRFHHRQSDSGVVPATPPTVSLPVHSSGPSSIQHSVACGSYQKGIVELYPSWDRWEGLVRYICHSQIDCDMRSVALFQHFRSFLCVKLHYPCIGGGLGRLWVGSKLLDCRFLGWTLRIRQPRDRSRLYFDLVPVDLYGATTRMFESGGCIWLWLTWAIPGTCLGESCGNLLLLTWRPAVFPLIPHLV